MSKYRMLVTTRYNTEPVSDFLFGKYFWKVTEGDRFGETVKCGCAYTPEGARKKMQKAIEKHEASAPAEVYEDEWIAEI